MQQAGIRQERIAFVSALITCGSLADVMQGNKVHPQIIVTGFQMDPSIRMLLWTFMRNVDS